MHRFLSFLLTAALLAGLCVPAMGASESADARLARVTQAVKDTLDLDTEAYPEFHGDVYEQELGTVWSLSWSGNGSALNIEALENGTIVSYRRSDENDARWYGSSLPTLPKVDAAAAKAAAGVFLARVLDGKTESVALDEPAAATQLNSTVCRFNGRILLNGLSSPLSYSISVRGSDNVVTSFRRDALATSFLGNIPSAKPAVTKDAAAQTLRGTVTLELIYVTDENDAARAVLRYVPRDGGTQYVDAQTGKLVSPADELFYGGAEAPAAVNESAMDAGGDMKRALTVAELAGIEKLEGVLASEELDRLVRAEGAYMLSGYTLASANYRLIKDGETETVLCTLRYAAPEDEDGFSPSRIFTVDARTGGVKSLYSHAPWDKDAKSAVSAADAQAAAEAFLARYSDHAGEFALYNTSDDTANGAPFYGFTFARKVNGYFFPEHSCSVQIDRLTGAVAGLSYAYDESVSFDAADGVVSVSDALDAWMATFDVSLAYRSMPKALDKANAQEAKLIDMGYTRFRTLLLTYALEREDYVSGIDAKTGKPVAAPSYDYEIAYGDVTGHWAKAQIDRLAACGVGYAGGSFRPDKALTQWELVALLASTQGMRLDPEKATAEERDSAYQTVYYMGALTREQRSDDSAVTRGELVRMLLGSAGYGSVAKLSGIFTCRYADRDAIPDADLGYAALAQGLKLVTNERYDAGTVATRAVAAVMLVRLMEREG